MCARQLCNLAYAYLVGQIQTNEDREKFDDELHEQPGQRRAIALLDQLGSIPAETNLADEPGDSADDDIDDSD